MHAFDLHSPTTLVEVHKLLDKHGEDARLLSGGTGLIQLMEMRLSQPEHLVALSRVQDLNFIERGDGVLRIGAMTSHRQVETSPLVRAGLPLLAEVYSRVASVRIRNMATVGGGLAHADPNQDPQSALIVLGAMAILASTEGTREVLIEDLSSGYYETSIGSNETLTEVVVPIPSCKVGHAFIKFLPRTADDYATVSVSVLLSADSKGNCENVRIALGSCGATPLRARQAENILEGKLPTPQRIRDAVETLLDEVDPSDDVRGSAEYKRQMALVMTRRGLEEAWEKVAK
jgi:carbon-monoxide dehydrogenase medium subunit